MKKVSPFYGVIIFTILLTILTATSTYAQTGWQSLDNGKRTYLKNDETVTNDWVTLDGEKYYLDENGICLENQWFSVNSVTKEPKDPIRTIWYYAGESGKIYRNGWYLVNGCEFYFNSSGGATRGGVLNLDGQKYYINSETGKEHSGWFPTDAVDSKGNPYTTWRYANADGTLLFNGWYDLDGKKYYFDANGANYRKRWFTIEDNKYYANEDGTIQEAGWFCVSGVSASGTAYTNWYYLSEESGQLKDGFFDLDGKTYYFDPNGLNYRKRWYVDEDGDRYYLEEDGSLQKNGWFLISTANADTGVVTDRWYYAGNGGKTYRNGVYEIEGKGYYFDSNSLNYRKRWLTDKRGRKQYLMEDGVMPRSAWFSVSGINTSGEEYTNWYYADENGYILTEDTYTIDGKDYRINKNGTMFTGWRRNSSGDIMYYGEDGAKRYGWQLLTVPSGWINSSTVGNYIKYYGNQAYFYFDPSNDGRAVRSLSGSYREAEIEGKKYCVDRYGMIQRGWARLWDATPKILGFGYYMPEASDNFVQGERAVNCWVKTMAASEMEGELSETWYYFDGAGVPLRASKDRVVVQEVEGNLYAFDSYGRSQAGFIELRDGSIYYFDSENKNAAVKGICQADDGTGMAVYKFGDGCKAISGISDGCLYYKGRLQTAAADKLYEPVKMDNEKTYLIGIDGHVVKDQTIQDDQGGEWSTDRYGNVIKAPGSLQAKTAVGPRTKMWDEKD